MSAGPAVVAVDVGGTTVKAALVAADGVVLERTVPTDADGGPEAVLARVLEVVDGVRSCAPSAHDVVGVGLAVPGAVDDDAGVVLESANLGWYRLPLRDTVRRATGLAVGFGHDVRTAAVAEARLGAGRDAPDHAYLSVGTGIAVAVVVGGAPYAGGGWAGELGHGGSTEGAACPCGGRGCPETVASAAGIARAYRSATGASQVEVPGAREVLERARAGDAEARRVWHEGVDRLGDLVAELVRVLAVRVVVVGGGLVAAGEELLAPLDAAVRARLPIHPVPRLVPAALGARAGLHGAALLGWDAARAHGVDAPLRHHVDVAAAAVPA